MGFFVTLFIGYDSLPGLVFNNILNIISASQILAQSAEHQGKVDVQFGAMKNEFNYLKQCTTQLQNKVVGKEILTEIINSKENYIRDELEKLRKELPGKSGLGPASSQDRDIIVNRVEGLLKVYKEKVSEDVQRLLAEERRETQVGFLIDSRMFI